MTREQLDASIAFLFGNTPIGIKLYIVLESEGNTLIRFADISTEVAQDLLAQFKGYIESKFQNNPELEYGPISDAHNANNSAYHYDIGGQPEQLKPLYDVNAAEIFALQEAEIPVFPNFSFSEDDLKKIKAFVVCLGNEANKIVLFKKHYPISLMKRGSYYGLIPSQTRMEKFDGNVIKINESVEFMLVGNELIVFSLKTFQNAFGYDKIIRSLAEENIVVIEGVNILVDVEVLRELAVELKFAKKIMRIQHHSPVLNIPFDEIRDFIKAHPKLNGKIKFNAGETRIALESRASKELFIKILNDDFLKSELTQLLYDSQKKAALDNNTEEDQE